MIIKRIYEHLQKKYRVAFIDNDTLLQSKIVILKPLTGILFFLLFSGLVIAGTGSLIVLTPFIREKIPGYTNPQLQEDYARVQKKEIDLDLKVKAVDSMASSLKRIFGVDNLQLSQRQNPNEGVADEPVVVNYDYAESATEAPEANQASAESNATPIPRNIQAVKEVSGILNLMKPVDGFITSQFNPDEKHFGVDLVADENAIIRAVSDGFVIFSEYSTQTGYVIGISHGNLISFYKHNSRVFKKVGSYVFEGEAIAVIGDSGENSTGPHLHLELWYNGKPVNPAEYINFGFN